MLILFYAHINIFHKKGYCFKIRMEFLRPILAKIELMHWGMKAWSIYWTRITTIAALELSRAPWFIRRDSQVYYWDPYFIFFSCN